MSFGTIQAGRLILTQQDINASPPREDLLGRRKEAHEEVQLSYDFIRSKGSRKFDELLEEGGTSTWQRSHVELRTHATGDRVVRQTLQHTTGHAGGSRTAYLGVVGAVDGTFAAGARLRFGLFDASSDKADLSEGQNGLFFQYSGNTLYAVRRLGSEDQLVASSDFNGAAGFVFDPAAAQVFTVEVDSSGCGVGRLGVLAAGMLTILHTFAVDGSTEMAALPVRYELEHVTGPAADTVCHMLKGSVISAGPHKEHKSEYVLGGSTPHTVGTQRTPVISLRLEQGCRQTAVLQSCSTLAHGAVLWEVIVAPSLVNAEWSTDAESFLSCDTSASAVSGGYVIASSYVSDGSRDISVSVPFLSSIAGVGVAITLCCTSLSGPTTAYGTLRWSE
jgi:hypothetical protein